MRFGHKRIQFEGPAERRFSLAKLSILLMKRPLQKMPKSGVGLLAQTASHPLVGLIVPFRQQVKIGKVEVRRSIAGINLNHLLELLLSSCKIRLAQKVRPQIVTGGIEVWCQLERFLIVANRVIGFALLVRFHALLKLLPRRLGYSVRVLSRIREARIPAGNFRK